MTRDEEAAIVTAWHAFIGDQRIDRRAYLEFVDSRIYTHVRFRRLSVFEVLDVLVNCEPGTAGIRKSA